MIQEIINYTKYLKDESPQIFEEGLEPSKCSLPLFRTRLNSTFFCN